MAGLMFVVCVPTIAQERILLENNRRNSVSSTTENVTNDSTNNINRNSVISEKRDLSQQEKLASLNNVDSGSKFDKQSCSNNFESDVPNVVIDIDGNEYKSDKKFCYSEEATGKTDVIDSSREIHHEAELPMEK
ncbi:hypothetical protein L9F63_011788, partial [Diploptera punctata]